MRLVKGAGVWAVHELGAQAVWLVVELPAFGFIVIIIAKTDVAFALVPDAIHAFAADELPNDAAVFLVLLDAVRGLTYMPECDGFARGIGVKSLRVHRFFGACGGCEDSEKGEDAH